MSAYRSKKARSKTIFAVASQTDTKPPHQPRPCLQTIQYLPTTDRAMEKGAPILPDNKIKCKKPTQTSSKSTSIPSYNPNPNAVPLLSFPFKQ